MEGGFVGALFNVGRAAATIGTRAANIGRTVAANVARNAAAVKTAETAAANAAKTAANVASSVKPTSILGRVATGAKSALTGTKNVLNKIGNNPYFVAANVGYSVFDPIYTEMKRKEREADQAASDAAVLAEIEAAKKASEEQDKKNKIESDIKAEAIRKENERIIKEANAATAAQLLSVQEMNEYRAQMQKDYEEWIASQSAASEQNILDILNNVPSPPPPTVAPPPPPPPSAPVIPTPPPPPYYPPSVPVPPVRPPTAPPKPPRRGKGKKVGGLVLPEVLTRLEAYNPAPKARRRRGGCYRLPDVPRFPDRSNPQIFPDQIDQFTPNPIVPDPVVRLPIFGRPQLEPGDYGYYRLPLEPTLGTPRILEPIIEPILKPAPPVRPVPVKPPPRGRPGPIKPPTKIPFRRGGAKEEAEILKMLNASR